MAERVYCVSSLASPEMAASELCDVLLEKGLTISCAESATCGFVAKLLTDRAGSSAWYWGGVESYANEAKSKILGVSEALLADPSRGPVTAQCAQQMADGMRALSGTDVALSVTGIAGPTGDEPGKPVGTVYFGFSSSFRESQTIRLLAKASNREQYRSLFASAILVLAKGYVSGMSILDIAATWL